MRNQTGSSVPCVYSRPFWDGICGFISHGKRLLKLETGGFSEINYDYFNIDVCDRMYHNKTFRM